QLLDELALSVSAEPMRSGENARRGGEFNDLAEVGAALLVDRAIAVRLELLAVLARCRVAGADPALRLRAGGQLGQHQLGDVEPLLGILAFQTRDKDLGEAILVDRRAQTFAQRGRELLAAHSGPCAGLASSSADHFRIGEAAVHSAQPTGGYRAGLASRSAPLSSCASAHNGACRTPILNKQSVGSSCPCHGDKSG